MILDITIDEARLLLKLLKDHHNKKGITLTQHKKCNALKDKFNKLLIQQCQTTNS